MADPFSLIGFRFSVYTWIVRATLRELSIKAKYTEANPFAENPDPTLSRLTPLSRVPVLRHGDFVLTETAAICRYLSQISGADLIPDDPASEAQMVQATGIMDFYGYVPMVRQVFNQAVFRPMFGEETNPEIVKDGLLAAQPALTALNNIVAKGDILNGAFTLADLHLAPMFAYFTATPVGAAEVAKHVALANWWRGVSQCKCLTETNPLPDLVLQ